MLPITYQRRSSSNLPVHEVKYKAYASDDVYLKPAHVHTDETRASEILLLIEQKPFFVVLRKELSSLLVPFFFVAT